MHQNSEPIGQAGMLEGWSIAVSRADVNVLV